MPVLVCKIDNKLPNRPSKSVIVYIDYFWYFVPLLSLTCEKEKSMTYNLKTETLQIPDAVTNGRHFAKNAQQTVETLNRNVLSLPTFTNDIVLCMEVITDVHMDQVNTNLSITKHGNLLEMNKVTCPMSCVSLEGTCLEVAKIPNSIAQNSTRTMKSFHMYTPLVNILRMHGFCHVIFTHSGSRIGTSTEPHPYCEEGYTMNIAMHEVKRLNTLKSCAVGQYRCGNGQCVSEVLLSDGANDCSDTTDELRYGACQNNTDTYRIRSASGLHMPHFCCSEHHSIQMNKVCDGSKDCDNGHDELLCNDKLLTPVIGLATLDKSTYPITYSSNLCIGLFVCPLSKLCIPTQWVNDLIADCTYIDVADMSYHYEDEPLLTRPVNASIEFCSGSDQFSCMLGHSQCFKISQICMYDLDIYGHITYCRNGAHLKTCSAFECIGMYKCPMSYCIQSVRVCDGRVDCPAGEDELDCPVDTGALICPGFLKCKGGGCVHPDRVCDGNRDCSLYGDDELLCGQNPCPIGCVCQLHSIECSNAGLSHLSVSQVKYVAVMNNNKLFPILASGEKVIILNLSHNSFDKISSDYLVHVPNVAIVDMAYSGINMLAEMSFSILNNLRKVHLEHNPITTIEPYSFNSLPQLQLLNMSNCSMTAIPEYALLNIPELTTIDLASGKLASVNLSLFDSMPLLSVLNILGNPLVSIEAANFSEKTQLLTDVGYLCCFVSNDSCIGATLEPSLCFEKVYHESIALVAPCHAIAVHIAAIIFRSWAGLTSPTDIVDTGVNLAGISVCFSVIMVVIQGVIFSPSQIHTLGGYKHVWCMAASAVQYVGLLCQNMFASVWIIAVYKVYTNNISIRIGGHHKKKIGCQLLVLVVILLASTSLILLIFDNFFGLYPRLSHQCSIYFPYEPKGPLVITMFALQLILQNCSFLFCCTIICLIVRIINRSDQIFNTLESRRIGSLNQKRKLGFLFIMKCLLGYVVGLPIQTLIIMAFVSPQHLHDYEWYFTDIFIPLVTILNPVISLLYYFGKMCRKRFCARAEKQSITSNTSSKM